jgi:hypothetical protein
VQNRYHRVSTFWWVDDEKIYGPAQAITYFLRYNKDRVPVDITPAVIRNMYDPIVLNVNHWIARCEPITDWDVGNVKYGQVAFWEYEIDSTDDNKADVTFFCGITDLHPRRNSPRFSVTRDGIYVGVMDMQSTAIGMTDPDTLYLYDRSRSSVTETKATKNWSTISNFALMNIL